MNKEVSISCLEDHKTMFYYNSDSMIAFFSDFPQNSTTNK